MALTRIERRLRIRKRIRRDLSGTSETPRMSVFRSNKQIYVQLIDDVEGKTLLSTSSLEKGILEKKERNKSEQARMVGELVAEEAKKKGIEEVVFDRSGYLYHGRIKELADAARKGGLKF